MKRRESLKLLALASLAGVLPGCTPSDVEKVAEKVAAAAADGLENRDPTILNQHEFDTVRLLADYIIPRDEHSGSASDAYVPEFIDFMMEDLPELRTPLQNGLAWLDNFCRAEHDKPFLQCTEIEQRSLLDGIAYPNEVADDMKEGARFFSQMRNLTATGFFSSKMGMEDLKYMGNMARPEWTGCPESALAHIGMSYES